MGILRSVGKFIGEFFFVFGLSLAIIMLTVTEVTDYNNLKPIVVSAVSEQITKQFDTQNISLFYSQISNQCSGKESIEIPISVAGNVALKCSDVKASKPEEMGGLIANSLFDGIYYKKYDCEFIQCYQQLEPQDRIMLFASSTANLFFKKVLIYLWIGAAASGILLLLSSRGWEIPKNFGKSLMVVGIPFIFIKFLKERINLPAEASAVQPLIDQLFNSLSNRYLMVLMAGIILVVIGYVGSYLAKRKEVKKS